VPLSRFVQPIRQTTTSSQLSPTIPLRAQKIVGGWLMGCAGMCFGAVVLCQVSKFSAISW
jgi:cytochrome c oxidase assembly protein subunit 15